MLSLSVCPGVVVVLLLLLVSSGDQMRDRDYRGKSLKCHFLLRKRCQGSENFALIFVPWTLEWSGCVTLSVGRKAVCTTTRTIKEKAAGPARPESISRYVFIPAGIQGREGLGKHLLFPMVNYSPRLMF